MPYFAVDDGFHSHPKVLDTSLEAVGLWALAGSWCADHLTDGIVKRAALRRVGGTVELAAELVDAGLWTVHPEGWRFHQWDERQFTREQVEAKRAAARDRMKRIRSREHSPHVRANIAGTSRAVRDAHPIPSHDLTITTPVKVTEVDARADNDDDRGMHNVESPVDKSRRAVSPADVLARLSPLLADLDEDGARRVMVGVLEKQARTGTPLKNPMSYIVRAVKEEPWVWDKVARDEGGYDLPPLDKGVPF